jgi:hypothetical protein
MSRVLFVLFLTACGGAPESGFYTGALEGTDARVAAVIEEDAILLYVCGGPSSLDRTRWLNTTLAAVDAHAELSLTVDGERFELARDDGLGLYHSRAGACRTGVIAGTDAIQGVSCLEDGRFEQVSPDGPMDRDGFMVQVGSARVFVEPARPEATPPVL